MRDYLKFYINGEWVDPIQPKTLDVINPADETVAGRISIGSAADVDVAAQAARPAVATWSLTPPAPVSYKQMTRPTTADRCR